MAGQNDVSNGGCVLHRSLREFKWAKVAAWAKGRSVRQRLLREAKDASQNDWATQGTVLAAVGGVSPDIKFNIFLHKLNSRLVAFKKKRQIKNSRN